MAPIQHVNLSDPQPSSKRTFKLIAVAITAGLLLVLNQNCAKMSSGVNREAGSSVPLEVVDPGPLAPPKFAPLTCENENEFNQGPAISDADVIKNYGRISHAMSDFGYISENGQPLGFAGAAFISLGAANASYIWFDFKPAVEFNNKLFSGGTYSSQFYCGVTTAGKVLCNQNSTPFEAVEIASLEGSTQIRNYGSSVCGLKSQVLKCYYIQSGETRVLGVPEPIVLLGADAIVGISYRQYLITETNLLVWDRYPRPLSATNIITPYSARTTVMCNQNIKSSSFPEFSNYVFDNGCSINGHGKLFCIGTEVVNEEEQSMSVLADGSISRALASIDPNSSYIGVAAYSAGSTCGDSSYQCRTGFACGIKSDSTISCFGLKGGVVPSLLKTSILKTAN